MNERVLKSLITLVAAALYLAPAMAEEPAAADSPPPIGLESLLNAELEGVEGTDIIVSRVTLAPNAVLQTHWHPGEEFAYMLSGSTTLWLEGEEALDFGPGEIAKIPFKRIHRAQAGEEGATILVFRVHQRGEPERVPVE